MREENLGTSHQLQMKLKFGEKPTKEQEESKPWRPPVSGYSHMYIIAEKLNGGSVVIASSPASREAILKKLTEVQVNGKIFLPLAVSIGPRGYGTLRPLTKEERGGFSTLQEPRVRVFEAGAWEPIVTCNSYETV